MATNRTWYTEANYVNADSSTAALSAKSVLWGMKALLCGDVGGANQGHTGARPNSSKWTVEYSSNSVTANSSDNWGTTFNGANMVRAAFNSPHSSIVLKSPAGFVGGPYYLALDYRDAADTDFVAQISKGAPSGISNTQGPTGITDSIFMNPSLKMHDGTATAWRMHLCVDANGAFYLVWGKSGSNGSWGILAVVDLDNTSSADNYKMAGMSEWSTAGGTNQVPSDQAAGGTTGVYGCAYSYNKGNAYAANSGSVHVGVIRSAQTSAAPSTLLVGVSNADSKVRGVSVPLLLTGAPNYEFKGVFPDMYHVGKPTAQGGSDPLSGNIDHIQIGAFRLPFNANLVF